VRPMLVPVHRLQPHIYEKLGVTSIDDLKFLGKQEILQSLASLPSFPRLKIATSVDS